MCDFISVWGRMVVMCDFIKLMIFLTNRKVFRKRLGDSDLCRFYEAQL